MESPEKSPPKVTMPKRTPSTTTNVGFSLKVLIYQFDTKERDIGHNIKRAEEGLSKYTDSDELDVVQFPEMPFTGYFFTDREDIRPYMEVCEKGETFDFCSQLAKRLNCYVICGYPELYVDPETNKEHFYNSAYIVNRDGSLYFNYRKHFLYDADYTWAEHGPAFKAITLTNRKGLEGKVAIAICMDIDYHEVFDPTVFELAEFCWREEVDAVFLLCAWPDEHLHNNNAEEVVNTQVRYWVDRLFHLLEDEEGQSRYHKKWVFYCADRVGTEGKNVFIGSSCVFKANPVEVVGFLSRTEEGILVTEVKIEE